MTQPDTSRGGAPVGHLCDLGPVEAGAVLYLRLWNEGPGEQQRVWQDFSRELGARRGRRALDALAGLCDLCARHARRPIMRHGTGCRCLGADEACFANVVGAAAQGAREDAMLIATLMVRPDKAPELAFQAETLGLALMRMAQSFQAPAGGPGEPAVLH